MAWMRAYTATTTDGWKLQTSISILGAIRDRAGGKRTGWGCRIRCWRRSTIEMRSACSASLKAVRGLLSRSRIRTDLQVCHSERALARKESLLKRGLMNSRFLIALLLTSFTIACSQKPAPQAAPSHPSDIKVTVSDGGPVLIQTSTAEFQLLPSG